MREIKFRAWDKKDNTMSKVLLFWHGDNGYGVQLLKPNKDIQMNTTTGDSVIIMQWSGAMDENGSELYECDIIQKGKIKYMVYFVNAMFMAQRILADGTVENKGKPLINYHFSCKKVGNTFENPII